MTDLVIRTLDIFISLVALAILSPVLMILAGAISLTGEGDILFFQERCGLGGKKFNLIKFATMRRDSESYGAGLFTEQNDPRLLPLGQLLRRSKLNELPQLFNVIRGDMSLVGWRPLVESTFLRATSMSTHGVFDVMPGLTGIASIFFKDEEAVLANSVDRNSDYFGSMLPKKILLDEWWVKHRTLWNYLVILFLTIYVLLIPGKKVPIYLLVGSDSLKIARGIEP